MTTPAILLPSDDVPPRILRATASTPLRIGAGLRLLYERHMTKLTSTPPAHRVTATHAGLLSVDSKRNAIAILSFPNRRYIPTPNDLVIAQIHHSSPDYLYCIVTPHTPHALLAQLAFEGATKKTRPILKSGDLVYARILSVGVGAGSEVELTCVNSATGKAEPGGLGPLAGGMLFDVSTGFAARLMKASPGAADGVSGIVTLEELGRKLEHKGGFEIAVGRNGKIWIDCSSSGDAAIPVTVAIGRCLRETDNRNLDPDEQRKLVSKVLREMRLDT
jgi:exosome complex component RRP40